MANIVYTAAMVTPLASVIVEAGSATATFSAATTTVSTGGQRFTVGFLPLT